MGAPGHIVKNGNALKHKIQDLIYCKAISFTPTSPNVATNPMSTHMGHQKIPFKGFPKISIISGLNKQNEFQQS